MKKIWVLWTAASLLLGGCSFENMMSDDLLMTMQNQNAAQTSEYEYQDVTQLQVAVGESTLNPYEMTTDTSLQVVPLLYDSLTKLNLHYG